MIEPLTFIDDFLNSSSRNFSRSLSFEILDESINIIPIQQRLNQSIELLIPRHPNLPIPPIILEEVVQKKVFFNFHWINLTNNISLHWHIRPTNKNVSYLFTYQFDHPPLLKNPMRNIDGWNLFCDKDNDGEDFNSFIDNHQTFNHQSVYLGFRELNPDEKQSFCGRKPVHPPTIDRRRTFSSNYQIQIYSSACFYLDENNIWQSHGLIVCFLLSFKYFHQNFSSRLDR